MSNEHTSNKESQDHHVVRRARLPRSHGCLEKPSLWVFSVAEAEEDDSGMAVRSRGCAWRQLGGGKLQAALLVNPPNCLAHVPSGL